MDYLYFFRSLKWAIAFVILGLLSPVFAVDIEVVFVKGNAFKVSIDSEKLPLKKGMLIQEAETLKTEKDSFVIFRIKGHSTHRLDEESEIKISSLPYFYEGSDKLEQGGSFILKVGRILSDVHTEDNGESLKLKTKHTSMGVRGTKFLFGINKDDTVLLSVNEGKVIIKNDLSGNEDFVDPNQSLIVENDLNFTAKSRYDFQKEINWNVRDFSYEPKAQRLRSIIAKEFQQKKRKWVRNNIALKKDKESWIKKEKIRLEKVRELKPSQSLERRRKKLRKILKDDEQVKKKRLNPETRKIIQNIEARRDLRFRDSIRKERVRRRIQDQLKDGSLSEPTNEPKPIKPPMPKPPGGSGNTEDPTKRKEHTGSNEF